MAEVQLLGITHYPPLAWTDAQMGMLHTMMLNDPAVPEDAKDPRHWPAEQQQEWGDDNGATAAASHRAELVEQLDHVRAELDAFDPDVIVIWGDDQYENFKEDLIPPYAILAFGDVSAQPWSHGLPFPNVWGEPEDTTFVVKGRPDLARWLAEALLEDEVDAAYAYKPLHFDRGYAHAFLNAVLYLDYHRKGFSWPVIAMPINCYGRGVISNRGGWSPFGSDTHPDPPSPAPRRLMQVGAAVARAFRRSDVRVTLLASSGWSHAFLTDHTWRLRPDTAADLKLYEALRTGDFATWEATTLKEIEHAGEQEVLNWFLLMGAARELGLSAPKWSEFVTTWCFNSNKVFAAWDPA